MTCYSYVFVILNSTPPSSNCVAPATACGWNVSLWNSLSCSQRSGHSRLSGRDHPAGVGRRRLFRRRARVKQCCSQDSRSLTRRERATAIRGNSRRQGLPVHCSLNVVGNEGRPIWFRPLHRPMRPLLRPTAHPAQCRESAGDFLAEKSHLPCRFRLLAFIGVAAVVLGLNVQGWRDRLFVYAARQPIQSLAILPLANFSGDRETGIFCRRPDGSIDHRTR